MLAARSEFYLPRSRRARPGNDMEASTVVAELPNPPKKSALIPELDGGPGE